MYFKQFPRIAYGDAGGLDDQTRKFAVDILRRVAFNDRTKEELAVYESYYIEDDDTPDIVAAKLYGNPEYHWIVLLFNNIVNPFYEWPLRDEALEKYIDYKYQGKALYLSSIDLGQDGSTSGVNEIAGITFAANETVYRWAGTADANSTGIVFDQINKGLVWNFDRQKCVVEIINREGPMNFSEGDIIIKKVPGGNDQYAYVEKVVDNRYGVHHFEEYRSGTTGDVTWFSPLSSIEDIPLGQTGAGPSDGFKALGASGAGLNSLTAVEFEETMIGRYMGVAGNSPETTYAVQNDIHEIRENDRKRIIKVLHPRYIDLVVEEFNKKIKSGTGRTVYSPQRVNLRNSL